ncbi:MAG TPA: CvpA family protein [Bacteroidota bacterium]|nr:CvpA family protein [Bacteroidota bacterium]
MSTFDTILLVILALFMFAGWRSGFIKKIIALVCLAFSLILATKYASSAGESIFVPMGVSEGPATIFAFLAIVGGIMLIQAIVYKVAIKKIVDGLWNKLAGVIVGLLEGGIIISMLLIFTSIYFHFPSQETKSSSALYLPLKNLAPQVFDSINTFLPESSDFYEEIISAGKKATSIQQHPSHQ